MVCGAISLLEYAKEVYVFKRQDTRNIKFLEQDRIVSNTRIYIMI